MKINKFYFYDFTLEMNNFYAL